MAFITPMNRNCIDALWSNYEKSVMLPPQLGEVRALLQRAATARKAAQKCDEHRNSARA